MGLNAIGAQTMRKTFAWRYYKETNDIYYIQNLLNHASPSITLPLYRRKTKRKKLF